jgi:hypothetical protein
MEAPHKPNGRPDAATPWSKSVMDGSYHTTEECDSRYHHDFDKALEMKRKHTASPDLVDDVKAEECIASDHPRLAK